MVKIKKLVAAAAISIFAFSAIGCSMIAKTPEGIKKTVLAKVEGTNITRADVDEIAEPYLEQYVWTHTTEDGEVHDHSEEEKNNAELATAAKDVRLQALELLIEEKIFELKATELNLLPTDEEVKEQTDAHIASLKESMGGEEKFAAALEEAGLTLEEYTKTLTTSMRNQLIQTNVLEDLFKDIKVEDSEIETYYNENVDSFKTADVSHILVDSEELANELIAKINAGEDFAELAKANSTDTASATEGGSLGNVNYGNSGFVQEFVDGMKALGDQGGISQPIKSDYGYHIIKVENVTAQTLEEAKETIKTTLETEKKNALYTESLEKWRKEYNVKTYENRL